MRKNRRPDDPDGGSWLVRPPGLEPGTHCLRVVTDEPQVNEGAVIPFHPRTDVDVTISGDAEVLAFPAAAEFEEVDAR